MQHIKEQSKKPKQKTPQSRDKYGLYPPHLKPNTALYDLFLQIYISNVCKRTCD